MTPYDPPRYGGGRPLVRSPRPWPWRLTCPLVRGSSPSSSSLAHLTASAPLSGPGHEGPYPAGYPGRPVGGAGHPLPVSRCLSAAGVRFSVILFPPRNWASLTVGLRDQAARTQTGLPRFARTKYDRGGCPLYPGDGGAHPGQGASLASACRSTTTSPWTPLQTLHLAGLRLTRHQRAFKQFTRPVFPSPVAARMEQAALGLSPELRTPPTRNRTTHVRVVGTGHRARTRNHTHDISRPPNPCSSFVACDLASQRAKRQRRGSSYGW